MTPIDIIGWLSALAGAFGTVLLALKGPRAGWGFVAYLASNAGWIAFAIANEHTNLLVQQVIFTITSLMGAHIWLVRRPPADAGETVIPEDLPQPSHAHLMDACWRSGLRRFVHGVSVGEASTILAEFYRLASAPSGYTGCPHHGPMVRWVNWPSNDPSTKEADRG